MHNPRLSAPVQHMQRESVENKRFRRINTNVFMQPKEAAGKKKTAAVWKEAVQQEGVEVLGVKNN